MEGSGALHLHLKALALLCEEGLVQLFPPRGYIVRGLSVQDVLDAFDLRVILEGAAAERAARHLTEPELDHLGTLAENDCCSTSGAKISTQLEDMRHSLDFHLLIAEGSRNAKLRDQIEKLLRASRRITSIGFTYGHHHGIVEALRSRSARKSRSAMEHHIIAGRDLALRTLGDPARARRG